jgi:hypothetical protein
MELWGSSAKVGCELWRSAPATFIVELLLVAVSDPAAFSLALQQPGFQQAAAMPCPSHPSRYEIIRD